MKIKRTLHKFQAKALASAKRYVCMLSGVQGGKTTAGAIWLSREVSRIGKDKDYLVVFPTYKIGDQSSIKKFLMWFPRNWGTYVIRDKVFKLKEGGVIYLRSAEDPTSLEGITASAAWVDEAGQISSLAWETILARLSIKRGKAFLTTTPYLMNWLFHDFYKKWEEGHEDYDVIQFASNDSPWFPQEEFDARAKTLDSRRFKLKYMGQFTRMEGLVYATFERPIHVIKPYKIPKDADVIVGLDYGVKNPAALIWGFKHKDELIICKEFYKSGQTIKKLAPMMSVHNPRGIYCDPSAKALILELKNVYGVSNVMPADNKVMEGISRVQELFNIGKIKIFSTCRNLIDELESYHYKEDRNGMMTDSVNKTNDHACDALRYLVNTGIARPVLMGKPSRIYSMTNPQAEWAYGE